MTTARDLVTGQGFNTTMLNMADYADGLAKRIVTLEGDNNTLKLGNEALRREAEGLSTRLSTLERNLSEMIDQQTKPGTAPEPEKRRKAA